MSARTGRGKSVASLCLGTQRRLRATRLFERSQSDAGGFRRGVLGEASRLGCRATGCRARLLAALYLRRMGHC